jgi:serine protease AprX
MAAYKWCLFFLCLSLQGFAQSNRYVVFFTDKNNSAYSISSPENFLSAQCLKRRAKQSSPVTSDDLPVNTTYVNAIRDLGVRVFFPTRWLNGVLVEMDESNVAQIQDLSFVSNVEMVAPGKKLIGGRVRKNERLDTTFETPFNAAQLQQLELVDMHNDGYRGENITIAVLDAGFPAVNQAAPFQHLFMKKRIKGTFDFIRNSGNVYQYSNHGTEVLSIIAANSEVYAGGAFEANFFLYVTEDPNSEYRIEEYNWLFAAEKADSVGVDIITTSLGYSLFDDPSMDYAGKDFDGKTAIASKAAVLAMAKGIVVVCSVGNEGPGNLSAPADAIGVLSVGAVDINGQWVNFSSGGPTADSRIKPDVAALGYQTEFINTNGTVAAGSGTSFAAPLVASLAAGVVQAFPFLKVNQVYEAITQSADQASAPDNQKGYGVPHFEAVKTYVTEKYSQSPDNISEYPTVADQEVRINFTQPMSQTTIYFLDIFGRILSKQTVVVDSIDTEYAFDVSGFSAGVYLIQLKNIFVTKTIRFVKR